MKLFFSLLLLSLSTTTLACKMTAMGASNMAIKAIMSHVAKGKNGDREISKIRQMAYKDATWAYVVETKEAGKLCKAVGYQAVISPSCGIKVQKLPNAFQCE